MQNRIHANIYENMANENLYVFNGSGPKLAKQATQRSGYDAYVYGCIYINFYAHISLYHTFVVILVDGFCDVALPHFEIKDSSKICRFFLFLMCLYCMGVLCTCTPKFSISIQNVVGFVLVILFCLVFFLCV